MRSVSPGEPILPALTAEWYNHTIKQHPPPPGNGPQTHRHQNRILAKLNNASQVVDRFTPVGIVGPVNDRKVEHVCYVNKSVLDEYNWIIPQAAMNSTHPTQECVYFGVTFASVLIRNAYHRYVTLDGGTNQLVSSDYGKGMFVQPISVNAQPQVILITIGNTLPEPPRKYKFELLEDPTTNATQALFYELSGPNLGTLLGVSILYDPFEEIVDVLKEGDIGRAYKQDGVFMFDNARCDQ